MRAECRSWWSVRPSLASLNADQCPVVGESPEPCVGALVWSCGHLVGLAVGDEYRSAVSTREVSGQQPGGAGRPDDYLSVTALADNGRSLAGQVEVLDIEGEDLLKALFEIREVAWGCCHPPWLGTCDL